MLAGSIAPTPIVPSSLAIDWTKPFKWLALPFVTAGYIIADGLTYVFYYLAYYILQGLAKLGAIIIRYIVKPIAVGMAKVLQWVIKAIRVFSCGYLMFYPSVKLFKDMVSGDIFEADKFDIFKLVMGVVMSIAGVGFIAPECLSELGISNIVSQPAPNPVQQLAQPLTQPSIAPKNFNYSGSAGLVISTRDTTPSISEVVIITATVSIASSDQAEETTRTPVVYSGDITVSITSSDAPYYWTK
jgi:hypothetical protein